MRHNETFEQRLEIRLTTTNERIVIPFTRVKTKFALIVMVCLATLPCAFAQVAEVRSLSNDDIEFGEKQVQAMTNDRPAMTEFISSHDEIWTWMARQAAGDTRATATAGATYQLTILLSDFRLVMVTLSTRKVVSKQTVAGSLSRRSTIKDIGSLVNKWLPALFTNS